MFTGDYEFLKKVAQDHVCPIHKTPVILAWCAEEDCFGLRCSRCGWLEEVTRQPSLTEEYRQGAEIPEPIKGKILKGAAKRATPPGKQPAVAELALMPQTDLGTGELLLPEIVQAIIEYAQKYDLDPYRGHVLLMYGKPYIGIDGYLYHANRSKIPYRLESRPLKETERENYKIPEGAHAWLATVVMVDGGGSFTGLGIVTQQEIEEEAKGKPGVKRSPVVARYPWQLAQKRAEWQALRRAFPIGEPEEVSDVTGDSS